MRLLKRACKIFGLLALCILTADAAFVFAFPRTHLPPAGTSADVVVVLGAAPNSPAIRSRASRGYDLYAEGKGKQLVLTGGITSVHDESEAMNMARYLLKNHQATGHIILEEHSTNTFENLQNTEALVPKAQSILIVSDAYHVPRAYLIARRLGFGPVYWDSPDSSYYKPAELIWYYGREMAALLAYIPHFIKG
jgi:uncharacterized SAM-binding protein YcdF (DUF218 family)